MGREIEEIEHISVLYVGSPNVFVPPEQRLLVERTLSTLNCYPVWLERVTANRYYQGYCKTILYPIFHNIIELYGNKLGKDEVDKEIENHNWLEQTSYSIFSASRCWVDYCEVNRLFCKKVVEIYQEKDVIWVHDYHLLVLPSYLFRKLNEATVGLFVHSPFPSSECFRMLAHREEILKSMLCADAIGFHAYPETRAFLTCCTRMLGLVCEPQPGAVVEVHYQQRSVRVVSAHIGITPKVVTDCLPEFTSDFTVHDFKRQCRKKFNIPDDKIVFLGITELEAISGIVMALVNLEAFLKLYEFSPSKVVEKIFFLQVALIPDSCPKKYRKEKKDVLTLVERINKRYGKGQAIVGLIEKQSTSLEERVELYNAADNFMLSPLRGQYSYFPFEYRLATPKLFGSLILSEFSTSKVMPGAFRFNPFKIENVCDVLYYVTVCTLAERKARCSRDLKSTNGRTLHKWCAVHLFSALEAARRNHQTSDVPQIFGLGLNVNFVNNKKKLKKKELKRLKSSVLSETYKQSGARLLIFDYSGTLQAKENIQSDFKSNGSARYWHYEENPDKPVDETENTANNHTSCLETRDFLPKEVEENLQKLANDPKNTVVVITSDLKEDLEHAMKNVKGVTLVAENGYVFKMKDSKEWEGVTDAAGSGLWYTGMTKNSSNASGILEATTKNDTKLANITLPDNPLLDWDWQNQILTLMEWYTETVNGSFCWKSTSAVSFNFYMADSEWGFTTAGSLYKELETVIAGLPLSIEMGKGFVTVRMAGVNRGAATAAIIAKINRNLRMQQLTGETESRVENIDFILCAGDDIEDEANFETVKKYKKTKKNVSIYNTRIGFTRMKETKAKYFVDEPKELEELLSNLIQGVEETTQNDLFGTDFSLPTSNFITKRSMLHLNRLAPSTNTLDTSDSVESSLVDTPRAVGHNSSFSRVGPWGETDKIREAWALNADVQTKKASGLMARPTKGGLKKNVSFKDVRDQEKGMSFGMRRTLNQSTPNLRMAEVNISVSSPPVPRKVIAHSPSYIATAEELEELFGTDSKMSALSTISETKIGENRYDVGVADKRKIPPTVKFRYDLSERPEDKTSSKKKETSQIELNNKSNLQRITDVGLGLSLGVGVCILTYYFRLRAR